MSYKNKIKELAASCFAIEDTLTIYLDVDKPTFESHSSVDLRKSLYKIRCDIMNLQRYAEIVDEWKRQNEPQTKNEE